MAAADSIIFEQDTPSIRKAVRDVSLENFRRHNNGEMPDAEKMPVLEKNVDIITKLYLEERNLVEAGIKSGAIGDLKPDAIADRIYGNVTQRLREAAKSSAKEYTVGSGPYSSMNAVMLATLTDAERYYNDVATGLHDSILANLKDHPIELAALKPAERKEKSTLDKIGHAINPFPAAEAKEQPVPDLKTAEEAEAEAEKEAKAKEQEEAKTTSKMDEKNGKATPEGTQTPLTGKQAAEQSQAPATDATTDTTAETQQTEVLAAEIAAANEPPKSLVDIYKAGGGAAAAFVDKEKIKATLRQTITDRGQNLADYPEQDIDGLATVIQESGIKWAEAHADEVEAGNLSHDRIKYLSNEFALMVRSNMQPERVGKFAGNVGLGMVSLKDVITGMDANGRTNSPYQMNLQGMAEAALTGQAGDEAARKRYLEQLALEESHRAFYAENKQGITPGMAVEVAQYQMDKGQYSGYTKAMVSQMTEEAFQPSPISGFFGMIWDWIKAIFAAFTGDGSQLAALFDGSSNAKRHEQDAASKNTSLYHRIANADPATLGYDGPQDAASFTAWRNELATTVTGIRQGGRGVYTDNNPDHTTHGLAAATLGLTPDGYSRVEGMTDIKGIPYDQLEQRAVEYEREIRQPRTASYQQHQPGGNKSIAIPSNHGNASPYQQEPEVLPPPRPAINIPSTQVPYQGR